ncbi:hypothetical protein FHW02_001608 [Ochrobactrum sp. RH1CCR137]|nr:hypothetical protein [Ochrobactrum sp. RH1CCR137]MBA8857929.1 hypothetical protein [Ochrobactrum sp. RH1CCR134]SUA86801.1 Uncharacterised protein [Brucella intermedia]
MTADAPIEHRTSTRYDCSDPADEPPRHAGRDFDGPGCRDAVSSGQLSLGENTLRTDVGPGLSRSLGFEIIERARHKGRRPIPENTREPVPNVLTYIGFHEIARAASILSGSANKAWLVKDYGALHINGSQSFSNAIETSLRLVSASRYSGSG